MEASNIGVVILQLLFRKLLKLNKGRTKLILFQSLKRGVQTL